MSGINKVILIGNLGNDIEIKYSQSGQAIVNLSIATSESWTDRNTGQKQEHTEWHRVTLFGKLAEIANQYLHKGSKVYVEGKLQTRKWQDDKGNDRYSTDIIVSGFNGTLQMLDKKDLSSSNYNDNNTQTTTNNNKKEVATKQVETTTEPDDFEDDIPF